ncbi:abortive infection family protein [Hymenobacter sp. DG25A]|uniref:abortive infection family protein n=1 Tax=Hymenobacter sp. DG25A TaxID=1385663 RepID=UPI001E54B5AF|nr:abortive infection family protein [Hymenobacter sp. DG25A]
MVERAKLEKILKMGSGYVLDFNDNTLQHFVASTNELDIHDAKYSLSGGSKAKKIREFWSVESDYQVSKLLEGFIGYINVRKGELHPSFDDIEERSLQEAGKIVDRLQGTSLVEQLDAIEANNDDEDFNRLAVLIRKAIEQGMPETALDRLYTFLVKFFRTLCTKYGLTYQKEETLHGLFGKYVKFIEGKGVIQSKMSIKIMKSSISIIDEFNHVRNNASYAHDNPVLNYHESILIFNNISGLIGYINFIEKN